MFKKTSAVGALAILGALSLFLLNCGSSSSRPSGLLYVLSQEQSAVSSYAVDLGSGNLSLINSNATTCATTPCGLPLQISLDPTAATAFVLNQGLPSAAVAPTVYAYTVNSNGSLSVPTSAAATLTVGETALAMARDAAGDLLFVITDAPAIYVFSTKPGSTTLTLASSLSLTRLPTSLSAITYTPSGGSAETVLFVTSNKDLTANHNDNELSVYVVDSSGTLTEAPNSPYTTQANPTVVQAVNTSPPGQNTNTVFVYVGNSPPGAGGVSAFQLCTQDSNQCPPPDADNHLLLPIGSTVSVGQNPVAMLVDPSNSFLYIACNSANQIYAFSMGTTSGTLKALAPANQPTGSLPVALAMHAGTNSNSEFLYVSNNGSSSITGFPVVATTGSLGSGITVQFTPGAPSGMAGR